MELVSDSGVVASLKRRRAQVTYVYRPDLGWPLTAMHRMALCSMSVHPAGVSPYWASGSWRASALAAPTWLCVERQEPQSATHVTTLAFAALTKLCAFVSLFPLHVLLVSSVAPRFRWLPLAGYRGFVDGWHLAAHAHFVFSIDVDCLFVAPVAREVCSRDTSPAALQHLESLL